MGRDGNRYALYSQRSLGPEQWPGLQQLGSTHTVENNLHSTSRSHVLWMPFVHNESMHRHICSRLKGFKLLPNIVKFTNFNSRVPAIELSNSPHESVTQTSAMRPSSDVEHDHDRLIVDTLGRTTDNIYWFPRTHFRKECIIGTPCFNRYRTILVDFRNGRIVLLYPETQSGHHL